VLPDQQLGETIALEDSERSYLIGSEGLNSTLLRIAFHTDAPTPSPTTEPDGDPSKEGTGVSSGAIGLLGGLMALIAVILIARRRSRPS
jgi:hypothetical protein